jgi:hypothetical protein
MSLIRSMPKASGLSLYRGMIIADDLARGFEHGLAAGQEATWILRGFSGFAKDRRQAEEYLRRSRLNCLLVVELPRVSYADAFVGSLQIGGGVEWEWSSEFVSEHGALLLDGTVVHVARVTYHKSRQLWEVHGRVEVADLKAFYSIFDATDAPSPAKPDLMPIAPQNPPGPHLTGSAGFGFLLADQALQGNWKKLRQLDDDRNHESQLGAAEILALVGPLCDGIVEFAKRHPKWHRGAEAVSKMFGKAAFPDVNDDKRAESVQKLAVRIYSAETVIVRQGTTDFDYSIARVFVKPGTSSIVGHDFAGPKEPACWKKGTRELVPESMRGVDKEPAFAVKKDGQFAVADELYIGAPPLPRRTWEKHRSPLWRHSSFPALHGVQGPRQPATLSLDVSINEGRLVT